MKRYGAWERFRTAHAVSVRSASLSRPARMRITTARTLMWLPIHFALAAEDFGAEGAKGLRTLVTSTQPFHPPPPSAGHPGFNESGIGRQALPVAAAAPPMEKERRSYRRR